MIETHQTTLTFKGAGRVMETNLVDQFVLDNTKTVGRKQLAINFTKKIHMITQKDEPV